MKTIIHIGGNKTASTLLQRRLFSKHKSLLYLGEDCHLYREYKPILDALVSSDDSYFDDSKARQMFDSRFSNIDEDKTCIFSNEDIMTTQFPSVGAARLASLAPNADVVMVIRNQLTVWPSWYVNHGAYLKNVPQRYWRRHVSFSEWLEYCFMFPTVTPVEAMNYHRFYRIFKKAYPESKIHVLLYEELKENPLGYYSKWAEILNISVEDILRLLEGFSERSRNSQRKVLYDRWMSKLPYGNRLTELALRMMPFFPKWLNQGPSAVIDLPVGWAERIKEKYRDGNAALARITDLDLKNYGYPV
jgi:hypothetical protein